MNKRFTEIAVTAAAIAAIAAVAATPVLSSALEDAKAPQTAEELAVDAGASVSASESVSASAEPAPAQ